MNHCMHIIFTILTLLLQVLLNGIQLGEFDVKHQAEGVLAHLPPRKRVIVVSSTSLLDYTETQVSKFDS